MSCPKPGVRANEAQMHLLFSDQDTLYPSVSVIQCTKLWDLDLLLNDQDMHLLFNAPSYGIWKIVQWNPLNDGLGSNPLLSEPSGPIRIIQLATTTFFLLISDLLTMSFRLFFYFLVIVCGRMQRTGSTLSKSLIG